jgi:chromatin remodeling complex protein RSC6
MGKKKRQPETLSAQLQRIIGESELTRYRICKMAEWTPDKCIGS